jgi:hypothetical protein
MDQGINFPVGFEIKQNPAGDVPDKYTEIGPFVQ